MDLGLMGKVALVTGAASKKGIGAAIARGLAAEGVIVVLTDIADGIDEIASDICTAGGRAIALKGDQCRDEDVAQIVIKVERELGGIDILINSAAITNNLGSIINMDPQKWRKEIDVSLTGPYLWVRSVLPLMRRNGWGRIVNISSTNSILGQSGVPAYVAAKGGLNSLTKQVALESAAKGITCNALVLGLVATEIYQRGSFDKNVVQKMLNAVPMSRMGTTEEVSSVAAFLCSHQASFITGALITVDGGMSLGT